MSEVVNSSLKTVVKGSFFVFFGMIGSVGLWFATKILIVRSITTEQLGIYSLVVALTGILSTFATLGLHDGVSRYISVLQGDGESERAAAISSTALRLGFASGTFFSISLYLFSDVIARYIFYKPEISYSLKVVSFFIPASVMVNIMIGILRGHSLIKPRIFISDIGQPILFLLLIGIFSLLRLPFISLIYAYTAAIVAVLIALWIYGQKRVGPWLVVNGNNRAIELVKFSVPLLMVSIMGIVLLWTDTVMLGRYAGEADVGIYNVSISLARLLTFPLTALEFVFMAIAGGMYARKEDSALRKIYQILTKWNFSATLPIFFILFFFPEMTITFLFGNGFTEAVLPLKILAVGFLFHAFLGTNGVLLMIMGMSRELMHISVIGTLLNIVLNYFLIKRFGYGIIGSAIATSISYFLINVMISTVLYRKSGIHPITARYLKPILGSTVVGLLLYIMAKSLALYLWMLPLYLLLYLGCYFMVLMLTRNFEQEDIMLFEAISQKTGLEMNWAKKLIYKFAAQAQEK